MLIFLLTVEGIIQSRSSDALTQSGDQKLLQTTSLFLTRQSCRNRRWQVGNARSFAFSQRDS